MMLSLVTRLEATNSITFPGNPSVMKNCPFNAAIVLGALSAHGQLA